MPVCAFGLFWRHRTWSRREAWRCISCTNLALSLALRGTMRTKYHRTLLGGAGRPGTLRGHARHTLSMPCATTQAGGVFVRQESGQGLERLLTCARYAAEATAQQHFWAPAALLGFLLEPHLGFFQGIMVCRCVSSSVRGPVRSPWPKRLGPNGRLTHKSSARFTRDKHM